MLDVHPYGIYVTAGKSEYGSQYEWGGCHITIAGFQPHSGNLVKKEVESLAKDFFKGMKWKPRKCELKKWNGRWTIIIKSKTLRKIANHFSKFGLKRIKGPDHCGKHFHITLPSDLSFEEAIVYANSLSQKDWYITVVESNKERKNFKWCKYVPLKK